MIKNKDVTVSVKYFALASLFWILSVIWLAIIIYLACEVSVDSTARSLQTVDVLSSVLSISVPEDIVRKGAHVAEFGVLSFLFYYSLLFTNRISNDYSFKSTDANLIRSENEYCIVFTIWLSTMVAFVSEYLQLYIEGRSGSVIDVLIDSVGIFVVLLVIRIAFSVKVMISNH